MNDIEKNSNTKFVIETKKVTKDYFLGKQKVSVLNEISLQVEYSEYVAIMGHSGAGKSTLLNILGCLDSPTSGEYLIRGINVATLKEAQLAQIRSVEIGFVFQNFNLLPKLDVAGNVELPLIYSNISAKLRRKKVEDVLKRLGIWDRRTHRPNEISGGQKQRVAIARALVKEPSLILADEPTGNLDSHTTEEILSIFESLNKDGNSIIVITHEVDVAKRANRLIKLADGKVVS